MAEPKPQISERSSERSSVSDMAQDNYETRANVNDDVSCRHALPSKSIYAPAWQSPRADVIVAKSIPKGQARATSIFRLENIVDLQDAVDRIWSEAFERPLRPDDVSPIVRGAPKSSADNPRTLDEKPKIADAARTRKAATPTSAPAVQAEHIPISTYPDRPAPVPKDLDAEHLAAQMAAQHSAERDPDIEAVDASFEPPRSRGAAVTLPDQRPQPERHDVVQLERIPPWLDPSVRLSLHRVEYAPVQAPHAPRQSNVFQFVQLVVASALGVALYVGVSGWVFRGQQQAVGSVTAPPQAVTTYPTAAGPALAPNQELASVARPAPEPQPILPFPLPRTYGVYAGAPGQLFELEQLPIKVPDPRVQLSAEITKPSSVTTPGENLSFVVFRRELLNSAPQTVTVRVVAGVQRITKFVNGKPTTVPIGGVWRIRAKSYEFKVSPLEGRNEMMVIQPNPGFVFPPGRYALVLNGSGYDFTVAGKVTAPEQCLEQVEVVNGSVLSECPKT